jgi:hypothetical protein
MTDLVILTPDGRLQIWHDGRVAWEVEMTTSALGNHIKQCADVIHRRAVQVPLPIAVQPWDV